MSTSNTVTLKQGESDRIIIPVYDQDGNELDISSYEATVEIKKRAALGPALTIENADITKGYGGANYKLSFVLSTSQTAALDPWTYMVQVTLTSAFTSKNLDDNMLWLTIEQ